MTLIFEEEDGEEQDNACKNSDEEVLKKDNKKRGHSCIRITSL